MSPVGEVVGSVVSGNDVLALDGGERDWLGAVLGLSLQLMSTTVQMNCSSSHLHDARYFTSSLSGHEMGWYLHVMLESIEQGTETSSSVGQSMELSGSRASVGTFGAEDACIDGALETGEGLGEVIGWVCVELQLSMHE